MRYSYLIVALWIAVVKCDDYKLELVQMVYRHGDRAPIVTYPNDPNPESIWKFGLGNLTTLGKRQQWSLGRLLRLVYDDFITTNPTEIHVMSAESDRCIRSAATNVASFYSPKDDWLFYSDVHWQPIPIHHKHPEKNDKYLNQMAECPKAEMLEKKYRNSSFYAQHKDACDYLTFHSGHPVKNWTSFIMLQDTLKCERIHNLTIPPWIEPYLDELHQVGSKIFYGPYLDPDIQYFRGGPLLGMIIDKIKGKVSGDLPDLKVQVYSAHDTTVAVLLACFNLLPKMTVPYAATLIFELYSGPSEANFVRLIYLNSTEPEKVMQEPHILVIDGCEEFCPLDYLFEITKNLIPKNWEEECKLLPVVPDLSPTLKQLPPSNY